MLSSRLIDSRDQVEALQGKKDVLSVITIRAMKKINICVASVNKKILFPEAGDVIFNITEGG